MRIAIVGELDQNGLSHKTYDAILKVNHLLQNNNGLEIDLIILETSGNTLDALPCDQVLVYKQLTGENQVEKTVEAIKHYHQTNKPSLVVVAVNDNVDNIIPNALIKINTCIDPTHRMSSFLECDQVLFDEKVNKLVVVKPAYGGNVSAHYRIESSAIISFNHLTTSKIQLHNNKTLITYVDLKKECCNHHINRSEMEYIKDEGLEHSDFVVVCGKGVGSKNEVEKIVKWATRVGAVVGGTKKVIDHGWLPVQQLIGQTGHTISPKTCLLIGISGATPFINGIIGSEKIIAINNDKHARIFDYADIGLVEDYKVIVDVLIEQISDLENK